MIVYSRDVKRPSKIGRPSRGFWGRRASLGLRWDVMGHNSQIILASSALALLALALFTGGKAEAMSACNKPPKPLSAEQSQPDKAPLKVGGECKYESYPGQARIVSIKKREADAEARGKDGQLYEVRFSFQPDRAINQEWVKVEGRTFLLTLPNGQLPDEKFLSEKGISVGRTLECRLEVITQGTCTPIMFFW
jgi:hypothetical protein